MHELSIAMSIVDLAEEEVARRGPMHVTAIHLKLGALSGAEFGAIHAPERPGEVHHIALDYTRAREELGWEPKVALRDGLALTLESVSSAPG